MTLARIMSNGSRHFYEFGEFRLSVEQRCLWHKDRQVKLTPKAIDSLILLVEQRGEIVSREKFLDEVWNGDFVEEGNINFTISVLRKALKNGRDESPIYIKTVPKRGYKFDYALKEVFDGQYSLGGKTSGAVVTKQHSRGDVTDIESPKNASRQAIQYFPALLLIVLVGGVIFFAAFRYSGSALLSDDKGNEIGSVAVYPFESLSSDDSNEVLSFGFTDSLVSDIARVNRFKVRPISRVEKYRHVGKDPLQFGKELAVDGVVSGSVQTSGGRIKVSVRFLDVRDGSVIWAESFEGAKGELFELQKRLASKVTYTVVKTLSEAEQRRLSARNTSNRGAYEAYLKGRQIWSSRQNILEAIPHFRKAVELDPRFALPYLGMADTYGMGYYLKDAELALEKAIDLDPGLHEAHASKGFIKMFHYWDWKGAEASLKRAVELAPNSAKALHWYGVFLAFQSRFDEAENSMGRALEHDPTSLVIRADKAQLDYFRRDYEKAESELIEIIKLDPEFTNAKIIIDNVRQQKGGNDRLLSSEDALRKAATKLEIVSGSVEKILKQYDLVVSKGHDPDGRFRRIEMVVPRYYLLTDKREKALDGLEYAFKQRSFMMPFIMIDPLWDEVRDEVRFQKIVRHINLGR